LLGILREKFPKKALGTVGSDLGRLVKTFANGQLVEVKKPKSTLGYVDDPSYGYCDVQVGRLNMPDTEILGNLTTLLETLKESEPRRTGGFITRCELYVEGLLENKFSVCHDLVDDLKWKDFLNVKDNEAAAAN
jgi:ribosomal protein L1